MEVEKDILVNKLLKEKETLHVALENEKKETDKLVNLIKEDEEMLKKMLQKWFEELVKGEVVQIKNHLE